MTKNAALWENNLKVTRRALQSNVGTVPRTVRILDCRIKSGNDNYFVIPSQDGIQRIKSAFDMIENLPSPLFRKEGKNKGWIAGSPRYAPGCESGMTRKASDCHPRSGRGQAVPERRLAMTRQKEK